MIEYKLQYPQCSAPPNTVTQILGHASGRNEAIELALFNDHRFAFYFWAKWNQKFLKPFDLVTFDWHQDLVYPEEFQKKELERIDLKNLGEVSYFSWARLNPLNDTHIMSSAYLNHIGDIWVLCKQGDNWEEEYIYDFLGQKHTVRKFKTAKELWHEIKTYTIERLYFDIDLDFFTIENDTSNSDLFYSYETNKFIEELLSPNNELTNWILKRTEGLTIALEPGCTGGISKSLEILSVIETFWFKQSIGPRNNNWKHLPEY